MTKQRLKGVILPSPERHRQMCQELRAWSVRHSDCLKEVIVATLASELAFRITAGSVNEEAVEQGIKLVTDKLPSMVREYHAAIQAVKRAKGKLK